LGGSWDALSGKLEGVFHFDSITPGMSLESEILSDLHQLLSEHGVRARWKSIDMLVLVSRVRNDQQIDMGGFVESPDLSLRVPKLAFPAVLPKFGERIEVDGTEYRISKVSSHPRSPLLTLSLSSTDE
jgi:hypothetical protein